jgi:antitoxin PrlF
MDGDTGGGLWHNIRMSGPQSVEVGPKGRIVIPAQVRQALGIAEGTTLVLIVKGNELVIMRREDVRDKLRGLFAGVGRSLADELVRERRHEAELENK